MKLQFLLAGIVATGLFASAPDTVAHGGFGGGGGHGGGGFHGGRFGDFRGGRFGDFHGARFGEFRDHRVFFQQLPGLFIGIPTILTITPIWITGPITTINIGTVQPRLCSGNPSDPPSTMVRLSWSSKQATPGRRIQAPILRTSTAATVRPTQQGKKE